ncbi:MAG: hypothetical protein A2Y62_01805 [Candidatus Fischerbacteria bacterium RBG_13_37_8]|uniref:Uncharacterized protein n=1 Tax=Candidatus Fischerbacteria bacterium RBG_13_37_8 TaxID=1817863 RepID=A0A1F5VF48_9BACT|nr:MAG: hypothetical protein A2Y62_01805 [Candidatus Fischerbacteria bacterium RBG_13_37_8]
MEIKEEELMEICEDSKIPLPEYIEEFVSLTPFAVEFRYGFIIDEILDINAFYQKVLELKKFAEKSIAEHQ